MSEYVASRLSADTVNRLGTPNQALREALVADLNALVASASIYDLVRFSNVVLSLETENLDPASSSEASPARLNRLLLEDAYRASSPVRRATTVRSARPGRLCHPTRTGGRDLEEGRARRGQTGGL